MRLPQPICLLNLVQHMRRYGELPTWWPKWWWNDLLPSFELHPQCLGGSKQQPNSLKVCALARPRTPHMPQSAKQMWRYEFLPVVQSTQDCDAPSYPLEYHPRSLVSASSACVDESGLLWAFHSLFVCLNPTSGTGVVSCH